MQNFFVKLKGSGRAGSEAFISQLSDTAISNETERAKANAQAQFQSSSFYTQAMSSVTGLASAAITTAVSAASIVGISATLLVIIIAVVAPAIETAPTPPAEVPTIAQVAPLPLPVVIPPIIAIPPAEAVITPPVPPTPEEQTQQIMQLVLQAIANDPGLQAQIESAPTPEAPLSFSSSLTSVPADGTVATDFANFISLYTCL
jgi:hypothetical protein